MESDNIIAFRPALFTAPYLSVSVNQHNVFESNLKLAPCEQCPELMLLFGDDGREVVQSFRLPCPPVYDSAGVSAVKTGCTLSSPFHIKVTPLS